MGCSFDRITATFETKEQTKVFADIYNEKLEDDFYWGEDSFLNDDDFNLENGLYHLWVEDEPLFRTMENGDQLVDVIYSYLEAVPDCNFYLEYECTFNNCGAIVFTTYDYKDGILKIVDKNSEDSYLDYCPECNWEAYEDENMDGEALCTIDEWEEDKVYVCPNCGAVLDWEVYVWKNELKMIDGKLVSEEDDDTLN